MSIQESWKIFFIWGCIRYSKHCCLFKYSCRSLLIACAYLVWMWLEAIVAQADPVSCWVIIWWLLGQLKMLQSRRLVEKSCLLSFNLLIILSKNLYILMSLVLFVWASLSAASGSSPTGSVVEPWWGVASFDACHAKRWLFCGGRPAQFERVLFVLTGDSGLCWPSTAATALNSSLSCWLSNWLISSRDRWKR